MTGVVKRDRWTALERRLIERVEQGSAEELLRKAKEAADEARRMRFYDWILRRHFIADREPINFARWKYLEPMYREVPEDLTGYDETTMKSSQGGATIRVIGIEIWAALRYAPIQIGHFLPTQDGTFDMSANRWLPYVKSDKAVRLLLGDLDGLEERRPSKADEGAVSVRKLAGSLTYFLYTGGLISTESKPLDINIYDEVQKMIRAHMQQAGQRVKASDIKAEFRLSTPTYEGAAVHFYYRLSNQQEFHTKCACRDGVVLSDPALWNPAVGPTCIGHGNGSTPGVPREPFWLCPKCGKILGAGGADLRVQDGRYIAHAPDNAPRIGWQFGQMLSPKVTASEMLKDWNERADTQGYFNRNLGRPFTDPNAVPITDIVLAAAEARGAGLAWGRVDSSIDGVFMGVDHMAGLNVVVVKGLVADTGRVRLLWLGWIEGDDPFVETCELMRQYRVRNACLEELPNINEADRFAKKFPDRVWVAHYQELSAELVAWGDRPRPNQAVRKTDQQARVPWTVGIDQHRMMSWSFGRWTAGEVELPNRKALIAPMRTPEGVRDVELGMLYGEHLKHIALKSEAPVAEGRESEIRKPRRFIEKIGAEDPHFALASMLCDVAMIRSYGADRFLATPMVGEVGMPQQGDDKRSSYAEQLGRIAPAKTPIITDLAGQRPADASELTCGTCSLRRQEGPRLRCGAPGRAHYVTPKLDACPQYIPDPEEESYP